MGDRDVFRAIVGALEGLGVFEAALLHQDPDRALVAADRNPVAVVRRRSSEERPICCDPVTLERVVRYEVAITLRAQDPIARAEALDRLASAAADVLSGGSLAGLTLPDRTTAGRWEDDPRARHPDARVTIRAEFARLVEGYARDPE